MVEDLPPDFVPRPRETERLLAQLLEGEHDEPRGTTTALRGAGGFGKTALARAIRPDERIQSAFDDGMFAPTTTRDRLVFSAVIDANVCRPG